ncbi:helix-hairpin-helix domain-containing protein [Radiobacillus deserti]|nr:helix-hairpin-helix domain-containing protein [Radiobacillus deserti]
MTWLKNNWFISVLFVIGIGLGFMQFLQPQQTNEPPGFTMEDSNNLEEDITPISEDLQSESATMMVDVKGEVKQPGVYEVDSSNRVEDVIKHAGGFTKQANPIGVNLAQRVQDEMVIYVPKVGEEGSVVAPAKGHQNKISINNADQDSLEQLNGIGEKKALAIIEYREEHGSFKKVEDLLEVPGIGEKTLKGFEDQVRVP